MVARRVEWIVEGDIKACSDEISHPALLDRARLRIGDKHVLDLVKAFLKAGIVGEDRVLRETSAGQKTPATGLYTGRRPGLTLVDRLLATILYQRFKIGEQAGVGIRLPHASRDQAAIPSRPRSVERGLSATLGSPGVWRHDGFDSRRQRLPGSRAGAPGDGCRVGHGRDVSTPA